MKSLISATLLAASIAVASFTIAAEEKTKPKDETSTTKTSAEHVMLSSADLKWGDGPAALPAGAKAAVLQGDPGKAGPFTIRLQMTGGYRIPPHTHPTAEVATVISGTFNLGHGPKFDEAMAKEMGPGSFAVLPAGMQHFAWCKDQCVVQVSSTGPFVVNYVNPADDPRQTKK